MRFDPSNWAVVNGQRIAAQCFAQMSIWVGSSAALVPDAAALVRLDRELEACCPCPKARAYRASRP